MTALTICCALLTIAADAAAPIRLDESPAGASQWGYRPEAGTLSAMNPPHFTWRPQSGIVRWQVQWGPRGTSPGDPQTKDAQDVQFSVYTPSTPLAPGSYWWRYRGWDAENRSTAWSQVREFQLDDGAVQMPMPPRRELLDRIPASHPRLFVRPEQLPKLRELATGAMQDEFQRLVQRCEQLLEAPPPTEEPPKYPDGMVRGSDPWRSIWWGNRQYTIGALDGAATLAFTRLLGGREEYGELARRILMDCARWDPKGSTGYRYNDEAGMPYAYYFSRTYTFVHDLLSDQQREQCQEVMRIRGQEMYRHLHPRHLWQPYSSHSNRAWHFLGEIGIAFHDEIPEAADWTWFAMNVFYHVYPVWSDEDGGWHEGTAYWASYLNRFTWWADVMRVAMDVDAYQKPFFQQAGYYAMYLMPPGKVGGGFGDLTAQRTAASNRGLMSVLAAQAGNGHWQWYVDRLGGSTDSGGYVGFVRGALPDVQPQPPTDLPTSRLFRGTGQAYLNTSLEDADSSVQVVFKSSPFGLQSHGYEANNSFLLWAYGQRLLIRSGRRDSYGSEHHRHWMWTTRSVNNITVSGQGQWPHSAASQGEITSFETTPTLDLVVGQAAEAYRQQADVDDPSRLLERFTRAIVLAKPDLVVVFDRLVARQPETFQYWLHAVNSFDIQNENRVTVRAGDVVCPIEFLEPAGLKMTQTDQYDPNPRERIKLREWHLTASTTEPQRTIEFVTVMRPHRTDQTVPDQARLTTLPGGYLLDAEVLDGRVIALLPTEDAAVLQHNGLKTTGKIAVQRLDTAGDVIETITEP
jgi:hypothetical protein